MENCQIAKIYPRIKSLLEEKYGIIKSAIVRGNLEEDNPQEVSEKELPLLSAGDDVWIQFFLSHNDIDTIMSGDRIAPECFNRWDEDLEEDEDLDDLVDEYWDNINPKLISIRLKLDAGDIVMLAQPCVYLGYARHKFTVYSDIKENVAKYLKEISVNDFGQIQLDEKGTPFVIGKKRMPDYSTSGYENGIAGYIIDEKGFKEDIQMLYVCLRCGIINIEKVWREPWLPICNPNDLLADAGRVDVYCKAWALMKECVLDETTDRCSILFMTINKILGFKSARRMVLSGTVESGLMKRGMMVCVHPEQTPHTVISIVRDGVNVDSAEEGDTVVVTLYDEGDYDNATGTYYDTLDISEAPFSCILEYDKRIIKFDHKKLTDMMNEKHYRPKHAATISTKMIRKALLNGGNSNLLQFVAESIELPKDEKEQCNS